MSPTVEAVVVNYNAGDALTRCVRSVLEQGFTVAVTVVDNASSDDSLQRLRAVPGLAESVQIVENRENAGFARAVNQAVDPGASIGRIPEDACLLVLNPDCEMLPGSLAALCAALDAHPEAALAGPLVIDGSGRPQRATLRYFPDPWKSFLTFSGLWRLGRRWPTFQGVEAEGGLPTATVPAEAVSGACMLVRKRSFLDAGRMDEAYGLHCEDLDLMYRLRQQGQACLFVPAARVRHLGGLSSRSRPLWVHWQKHRGMQRFFRKFQAGRYPLPLRWLVIAGIWLRFALTLPLLPFRRRPA